MHEIPPSDLTLSTAGPKGRGVFLARAFRKGDVVLAFAGARTREEDIQDFTYTIQVDVGIFLGPSGGMDDYVNHCCDPSCLLRSTPPALELIAIRDLGPGEEVTFDYATCISTGPSLRECLCGAASCRGAVGTFWDLERRRQEYYLRLGGVPDYVQRSPEAKRAGPGALVSARPKR